MNNCLDCTAPILHSPCAAYCPDCQSAHDTRLELERNSPRSRAIARHTSTPTNDTLPTTGIFDGQPNVTCPACAGCYHYGPPVPFTHLCPLCMAWLCWRETDEIITKRRRVRKCPSCGGGVTVRSGKYGEFYGCDNYPTCKGIAKGYTVEEYDAPRLGLVTWKAYVWDDGDEVDHFAKLDRETQGRMARIEGREMRRVKWWERKGLGLDTGP